MTQYIYKLIASDEEKSVSEMEARALLCKTPKWIGQQAYIISENDVNIERSVFLKWKLQVIAKANSEAECVQQASLLKPLESYRLNWLDSKVRDEIATYSKQQRRSYEQKIAAHIEGEVSLTAASIHYGVVIIDDVYFLGYYSETTNTWQQHHHKPRQYSTALSTRLARSLVNIAIPTPVTTLKAVDPCCGIGTVLLEVAALGVYVEGYDNNPVVLKGTRENIAFYGYNIEVKYENMLSLTSQYDVAFLDLPYNLCSVLPDQEKRAMLTKLKQLAKRFVIVSIEPIEHILNELNIHIADRGVHYKGKFKRELFLCTNENGILLK